MNVLIVTHYFPPEIGAPQARLSELARLWADAGATVTVLTGMPNHPTGVVPPRYRGRVRMEETIDGYRVLRTWLYATPNEKVVRKTLGHLSFMVSSVVLGATRTRAVDAVVVSSPTFFSILSAWALARIRRARLVVEIRDLWPAVFVDLGILKNPLLIRTLERLEMAAYRAADAVVVVTDGFRDDLTARGVPAAKVRTIRNGADLERFRPTGGSHDETAATAATRSWLGAASGDTLVVYVGAHGLSQGLTAVAESAAKLAGEPIHFAFVGDGAAKAELTARVAEMGLDNVTLRSSVERDRVPALLAAADICLAPLRDIPIFDTFIPSKIFEYLAAGRAVIGAVRGETAAILRDAGAVVVEPEDPGALAAAVRDLAARPERRAAMGEGGRAYATTHFDRRHLARTYHALLEEVVAAP